MVLVPFLIRATIDCLIKGWTVIRGDFGILLAILLSIERKVWNKNITIRIKNIFKNSRIFSN